MPSTSTGKRRGKRTELAEWLGRVRPERVGESEFGELLHALAPVSENYLRRLLRESGVPLAPTVEGVRQSDLGELERSLSSLLDEYEAGDAARRTSVRRLVIEAKDHARLAARKRPQKQEMVLWMTTWLDNPPVFREWVRIRRSMSPEGDRNY